MHFIGDLNPSKSGKNTFEHLIDFQKIVWQRKSRAKVIKVGDRNAKYLHWLVKGRRNFNRIDSLNFDGVITSAMNQFKEGIVSYFNTLFAKSTRPRPRITDMS